MGDFTKTFHVILGPDSQGIQVLAPYQYYMRKKNEESETVNITRVRDGEVLFTLTMDKDYFGIIEGAKMPVRFTKEGPGGTGVWTVFYHDDEPNAALLTGESKETEICFMVGDRGILDEESFLFVLQSITFEKADPLKHPGDGNSSYWPRGGRDLIPVPSSEIEKRTDIQVDPVRPGDFSHSAKLFSSRREIDFEEIDFQAHARPVYYADTPGKMAHYRISIERRIGGKEGSSIILFSQSIKQVSPDLLKKRMDQIASYDPAEEWIEFVVDEYIWRVPLRLLRAKAKKGYWEKGTERTFLHNGDRKGLLPF
ncbi:MAG: hypothetical protein V3V20_11870 [Algisphaera sp.]